MHKPSMLVLAGVVTLMLTVGAVAQEHAAPAEDATHGTAAAQDETGHGEAHGDHAKPALLQFDPGAAIWSIVVFVLLLVLLRATAWKPILRVLNEREQMIQKSIDEARHEREEAEKLLKQYQEQLEQARREATAIVEEGRRDAQETGRRIHEEARQQAEETLERARRDIELARDSAIKDLYDQTAELAVQVAGGILQREISPDDHRKLVTDSIERMKGSGDAPSMN